MNAKNYRQICVYLSKPVAVSAIHMLINLKSNRINIYSEQRPLLQDILKGRTLLEYMGRELLIVCYGVGYYSPLRKPSRCGEYKFNSKEGGTNDDLPF